MESVASETVDSTLIVNGTSSSQENTEISATYSWSNSPERDLAVATIQQLFKILAAAIRIQKHYRGYRTRRNLADSIIAAELLWQTTLSRTHKGGKFSIEVNIDSEKHIESLMKWAGTSLEKYGKHLSSDQLALLHCWETIDPRHRYSLNKYFFYLIWGDQCFLESWKFDSYKISDLKSGESLFTTGKPTSVELRMNTASSTQNWISELTKVWKTWKGALQRWLEVIDPRHRVGRNLNCYFQIWMTSSGGQPFFYWLDVGDGKTVEHLECSREKLRHERNAYLEQASNSEAVESPAPLIHRRSFVAIRIEEHLNDNQRTHNGPADGFNLKDLLRRIFYAMNLLLEIATAVLDYVSSQQRQPRYALSGMILSITVMAITLMQLAYTGGKENCAKLFGNPVHILEFLFSVSQCVFAIIAYHYLSRDQNNPTQFSIYPIAFAFCLLCLSFRRREP
uniref:Uncharacterized protein n=1 Tax=Populus trichocarpa TaxID=3694 RepID=A0A3N7HVF3_POPTR